MQEVQSKDGSYTAYSSDFDEHYHSTQDGALSESLAKHVIPTISRLQEHKTLRILDICFGLGFNTLATLYYIDTHDLDIKVEIISPEFDVSLVHALDTFSYPKEFDKYREIIVAISANACYQDSRCKIDVILGDARTYLLTCKKKFDIVYQDAFSPQKNPLLWTSEYFTLLSELTYEYSLISTYSTAFKIRLALFENGFNLYLLEQENVRDSTLASKSRLDDIQLVNMEHKILCNQNILSLKDEEFR